MTRRAIDDVLDHSKSRLATRLVLIALASYANEDGFAWPGIVKLQRRAGLARSTVWLSVQELLRAGEIRLHDGPVPGREHAVRSYTFLITVSGFEPLDDASDHTVSGFVPLYAAADGEVDTVSGIEPLGDAQPLAPDSYFEHQGFEPRTSGVRSTSPPVDLTSFQDSDKEENRKGTVKNRYSEERSPDGESHRAVALVDVNIDQSGLREMARVALSRLVDTGKLRPLLAELGWDEERDGKVSTWLTVQDHAKLRETISKAHDALAQTAREKKRAGGQ